jgi:hypothetical protein
MEENFSTGLFPALDERIFAYYSHCRRQVDIKRGIYSTKENFGPNSVFGSSQIRIGGTIAICGVNVQIGCPSPTYPEYGDIGQIHTFAFYFNLHAVG